MGEEGKVGAWLLMTRYAKLSPSDILCSPTKWLLVICPGKCNSPEPLPCGKVELAFKINPDRVGSYYSNTSRLVLISLFFLHQGRISMFLCLKLSPTLEESQRVFSFLRKINLTRHHTHLIYISALQRTKMRLNRSKITLIDYLLLTNTSLQVDD